MKKIIIALTAFCSIHFFATAQDSKKYREMATELEKTIWETKDPMFENNKVPDEYKNESAVVLAEKHAVATDSKRKTGFFGLPTKNFFDKKIWKIFHQKILLNDQTSLNEFSEISYAKLDSKSYGLMGGSDLAFTFLGIKIIKPNGTVEKVAIDESAVTVKSNRTGKANKIAVPNLAIGDIVDYYVASYDQVGTGYGYNGQEFLTYVLTGENPILNLNINLVFDKRVAVEYQCINGAPDFKKKSQDDDNILELNITNVKKLKNVTWTSQDRQLPIIRLRYLFGDLFSGDEKIDKGEVRKVSDISKRIEKQLQNLLSSNVKAIYDSDPLLQFMRKQLDDAKKTLGKNRPSAIANQDSLAALAYYINRMNAFYGSAFTLKDDFEDADRGLDLSYQLIHALRVRSMMENGLKIDCEFIDLPSRYSVTRKNLFHIADLSSALRINTPKPVFMYLGGAFYNYGEVPSSFEAENGAFFSLQPDKAMFRVVGYKVENEGNVKIPELARDKHISTNTLKVSLDAADNQLLNINRNVKAKGQMRRYLQASVLMPEDVLKEMRAQLGLGTDLVAEYTDIDKAHKKSAVEFESILKKAREKEKEKYEAELKEEYDEKVKELKSFKVLKNGMHHMNNEFEMEEEFTMNGWVKKAGNNLIVEVGKLIGGQFEIKADQRERTVDIYMPQARTYNYSIEFTVPDGYTVDGIDKLNKKVENECGGFVSTATLNNNKLTITTTKYYNTLFEKAENWKKIAAFVDAAFEFGKEKILLRKK